MQKFVKHKIVIIGCGNVAWHLAKHLSQLKKFDIIIYNHKANVLLNDFKAKLKCSVESSFENILNDADYYFVCVTDKFISTVAKKVNLQNPKAIIIHTSGSAKIEDLGKAKKAAVFYPLQSFSKKDDVNWKEIPIIIESKSTSVKKQVSVLANYFSKNIYFLNYKERLKIHLAAVFVNNFTNALFVAANSFVSNGTNENNFKILMPLIKKTILKAEVMNPIEAQTGPAKRKDETVMKKHLKLLSKGKNLKSIYKQISGLIVKQQTKRHA